jgi:hypothetical protein
MMFEYSKNKGWSQPATTSQGARAACRSVGLSLVFMEKRGNNGSRRGYGRRDWWYTYSL